MAALCVEEWPCGVQYAVLYVAQWLPAGSPSAFHVYTNSKRHSASPDLTQTRIIDKVAELFYRGLYSEKSLVTRHVYAGRFVVCHNQYLLAAVTKLSLVNHSTIDSGTLTNCAILLTGTLWVDRWRRCGLGPVLRFREGLW